MGRCHHEAMLPEQIERRPWLRIVALLLGLSAVAILIAVALARHSVPTARPTPPTQLPSPSTAVTPPVAMEHLSGLMPSPREFTAMAYDALHREIVLFGGLAWSVNASAGTTVSDTWTFQGRSWSKRDPMTSPGPLANDLMIYDDKSLTCLLVGKSISAVGPGGRAETWSWNGSSWTRLPDIPPGTNEVIEGFAFDRTHGEAVLLSWASPATDIPNPTHTWTWDGRSWAYNTPCTNFLLEVLRRALLRLVPTLQRDLVEAFSRSLKILAISPRRGYGMALRGPSWPLRPRHHMIRSAQPWPRIP